MSIGELPVDDAILDSLSVPTGEAGWPQLGDWLYCVRENDFIEPEWVWIRGLNGRYMNYQGENFFDYETYNAIEELKQDFPRHVPIMKLLGELVESRKYIEQAAPLLHIHGFEYKKGG